MDAHCILSYPDLGLKKIINGAVQGNTKILDAYSHII